MGEVAIVQTQPLEALPVLQLVALTAIVVLVGVVEYKLLEATFHGRHGALVSIRRKMSAGRSTWRTGSVARRVTVDSGDRWGTTAASAGDPSEEAGSSAPLDVPANK